MTEKFTEAQLKILAKLNNLRADPNCPLGCVGICRDAPGAVASLKSKEAVEVHPDCPNSLVIIQTVAEIEKLTPPKSIPC